MSILGERLFDCEHAYHMFRLHDRAHDELLGWEPVRIGFFELTKQSDTQARGDWREFLLTGKTGPDMPRYLQEAARVIDYVNLSREERKVVDLLEKARVDQESLLRGARAEGLAEGVRENQLANARAALGLGVGVATVSAITRLSVEEVQAIADE